MIGRRGLGATSVAALVVALAACGGDGGDVEAFCATARQFAVDNPADVFDRYDPEEPATAAGLLRDAAGELDGWAGDAPDDVQGAIETIADAAEALAGAFEEPSDEATATLRDAIERVEAASRQVVSFTSEECGVDLEPTATTVTVQLGTTTVVPADG